MTTGRGSIQQKGIADVLFRTLTLHTCIDMCIDFMETLAHNHEETASIQLCPEIFSYTKERDLSERSALPLVATSCDGFLVEVLFQ